MRGEKKANRSSLHYCLVWLGAEVSEVMERAFGVVLAGRKMRPFELPKMPELELLDKACPQTQRFREENHGPHRLVVRTSRCGRDNLGSNPSVALWSRRGTAWQTHSASLLQECS